MVGGGGGSGGLGGDGGGGAMHHWHEAHLHHALQSVGLQKAAQPILDESPCRLAVQAAPSTGIGAAAAMATAAAAAAAGGDAAATATALALHSGLHALHLQNVQCEGSVHHETHIAVVLSPVFVGVHDSAALAAENAVPSARRRTKPIALVDARRLPTD